MQIMHRFRIALAAHQYILFIGPAVVVVLAFTAYPAAYGVFISFTNMHFAYPDFRIVGVDNYVRLLTSPNLPGVALTTVIFVGSVVVLQLTLGLMIALLLNRNVVGRRLMRSISILPWIIPSIIIAIMFQQFFNGSRLGIMNTFIGYFGLSSRGWLSSPTEAMTILILALVWRGVPLSIILQLGALQTVPKELHEAAAIDGATRWQRFRYVTLPTLKPVLLINIIMVTSGTLNHIDIPLALTGGGPGDATMVLALELYKNGFLALDAGYASTIATVILLINLTLTIVYLRILRSRDHED
jgi:ABC-type sugar transport system permease subunit